MPGQIALINSCSEGFGQSVCQVPSGQNLADSAGNPRGWWLLVEGIHAEIWAVSETRIDAEI